MNWKTFLAMLYRDGHVARRNFVALALQTLLQPMLFVFIFGRVLTRAGMLPAGYKSMLLPGIMAMSMLLSGIQAVAMPLIAEFQFTREIEDRLLAPMRIHWLAVEKVVVGVIQALAAGLVVMVTAALVLQPGLGLSFSHPFVFLMVVFLVALLSATGGLTMGCSVGQTQIGLMFSLVLAPMIFFGCAYYPWSALGGFPILQKAVLINPLVYACEGLRGALVPQLPHLSLAAVVAMLILIDLSLFYLGLLRFHKKAVS